MNDIYEINRYFVIEGSVLGIWLKCPDNSETMVIYCVYLPPEGSKYSVNNKFVLNSLTINVYSHTDVDDMVICGDFNGRIGSKADCANFDNVASERHVHDTKSNARGDKVLTFVKDIKGCIVNGRITHENDGFTSVTYHKGNTVVDYFIV